MRPGIFIILLTAFFVYNTYHDGKYTKILKSWTKYYKMGFIAFVGVSIWLYINKSDNQMYSFIKNLNGFIKCMPIDRDSKNMIEPLLNLSTYGSSYENNQPQQEQKILKSGSNSSKRSVSETKKKYVASNQNWRCNACQEQLTAWFEVDHVQSLENGGTNDVNNLVALCRNCHGKKTAMDRM